MSTLEKYYKCIISNKQEKKIARKFYIRAVFIMFFMPIVIIYTLISLPLSIYYDIINNEFMTSVITGLEFLCILPIFIYMIFFDNPETVKKLPLNKRLFVYIYFAKKYVSNTPITLKRFSIKKMVIHSIFMKLWYLFDELEVNSKNLFICKNKQLEDSIASIKSIFFRKRKSYYNGTEEERIKLQNILTILLELYYIKNEQEDFILYNNILSKSDLQMLEVTRNEELTKLIYECKEIAVENNHDSPKTVLVVLKSFYYKWRKLILLLLILISVVMVIYYCNKFVVIEKSVAILLAMAGGGIFQIIGKIIKSKSPTDKENKAT